MFQMKSVEMVHWDFWQRLTVPLDAQIVTIIGPNGSGKTTLLDALRTLLAIKCSGKRDYKRYVRNNREPFAYLKGVVDNPRRLDGSLYPTPFFPLVSAEVTLLCRIKKQGGDWVRHYAIAEGDVALDSAVSDGELAWLGVQEYRRRLEAAGLTAAVGEVLALEQGDTDKLTEYSPKQLLDLVFQVFGDKDVLDNYQHARDEQRAAEAELNALGQQQEALELRVEAMKSRANRYLEWVGLQKRVQRLRDEALPVLGLIDGRSAIGRQWGDYRRVQQDCSRVRAEHDDTLQLLGTLRRGESEAQQARADSEQARQQAQQGFMAARDALRDVASQLKERDRLQALAGREYGADAATLEQRLAALRADADSLRDSLRSDRRERDEHSAELAALESGKPRAPEDVRHFRAALDEAGIAHSMLSDIVEVSDARWQGAVEALLKPYRHVVLLHDSHDKRQAWQLGERLRYRHFVVPETEAAPRARSGSLLEVVRFAAAAPDWLYQQMNRVSRVDDVDAGAGHDGDWITPEGYFRERRGARHIGVPQRDFAFGEAARLSRLQALRETLTVLNSSLLQREEQLVTTTRDIAALADYLSGMDSIAQLASRADEFAALADRLPGLEAAVAEQGALLAAADEACRDAEQRYGDARLAHDRVAQREQDSVARLAARRSELQLVRRQLRQALAELRDCLDHLPPAARDAAYVEALADEFESAADVRHEIHYLEEKLGAGDWECDDAVLQLKDKLQEDLTGLSRECQRRHAEVERAAALTEDAREAYLGKLRATVRAYGSNVKRLGELAGIGVEVELPVLSNDDLALAQAGLVLKFNFDQKGLMGMNDGEASGGQQVMKSLILLIGLMMDEANPSGFVFIDEPFAHLDIFNIDRVAGFLKATEAQYLITTPNTHNINIFAPSALTLATRKKRPGEQWAPAILQTRRRLDGDSA